MAASRMRRLKPENCNEGATAIEFLAAGSLILANFDVLVINFPPVLLVKY